MFIEDHEAYAQSVLRLVADAGLKIDWVDSYEKGVEHFRVGSYELVIADYNLVGSKHGLKLLAEIKKLRPSARLVLISGQFRGDVTETVSRAAFIDDFFVKNDDAPEKLLTEIQAAAKRAMEPTDWKQVAAAQLDKSSIDDEALENIDRALRAELRED